jgi:7-cyano-7-deazaguanine synthase
MSSLLLLSGGLDSAVLAAAIRPSACLFVDYGQRPASSESEAARFVSDYLAIDFESTKVDLSHYGSGLLVGSSQPEGSPSEEWFPYRNQFLVTIASAMAIKMKLGSVALGVVGGDGSRHVDGTECGDFVATLDCLLAMQESGVRLIAPHLDRSPSEVLAESTLPANVLLRTHSCHVGDLACGQCPGCLRRIELLRGLGVL